MRQPAKGHSKFGDQLQNMHINQVCSDIDHLAAGPEKKHTLKNKQQKFANFVAMCVCVCVRVRGMCVVVRSTRRRVSSILEIHVFSFRSIRRARNRRNIN